MVVRLALAPPTARLTRAIVVLFPFRCGWVGRGRSEAEHPPDAAPVAGGDPGLAGQAALVAGRLLLEHVVQPGPPADQLAVLGDPEAGGGAPVGLHLRHGGSWVMGLGCWCGRAPDARPARWGPGGCRRAAAAPGGAGRGGGGGGGALPPRPLAGGK